MEKQITSIFSLQPREKKAMLMVLIIIFLDNIMKMEFREGRKAFNLFLTTNMALVTSLPNKQLVPHVCTFSRHYITMNCFSFKEPPFSALI